ncbi:hypothetical protein H0O00_03415 [Candidatus Micrarchaeota archaeon]|nr:hypothetical protein [Candidatus Micrarchaeota archaeon]
MKVKCDKCKAACSALVDELITLGWSQAVIPGPIKITLTRCPVHRAGLTEEIGKAQGMRVGG